ncbi:MAG TPA: divalent metal cation transporter [Candidatus Aquilonibacter sp.]
MGKFRRLIGRWVGSVGPGLVTGAADDDPSGIATYSIAGAQTGYTMLWVAFITTPMMAVIDGTCARIAMATNKGLMRVLRSTMPYPVAVALGVLVVIANTFNIGADIAAMAASATMLSTVPPEVWIVAFSATIVIAEVYLPYRRFARVVEWLCAALLAYVVTAFVVHPPWLKVIGHLVVPSFSWQKDWLTTLTATLGTTITPYLFFWQTSMTVEDSAERKRPLAAVHADANTGAIYSNLIMFFIVVTAAATLGAHGKHTIATAQDAASALKPLAGQFAFAIFTVGIVGTGLLAVPVLAGSSAYITAELLKMREGLAEKPRRAPGFYGVIAAGVLAGMLMALMHVDPIGALFWSAVLNGVASVPLLYAIIRVAADGRVLGEFVVSRVALIWLWLAFGLMTVATLAMFASWIHW